MVSGILEMLRWHENHGTIDMTMTTETWQRLLEVSVALEMMRSERDQLRSHVALLRDQLQTATQRAERAEDRLQESTRMIAHLGMQAILGQRCSSATEVHVDGKSVLRLYNPVFP